MAPWGKKSHHIENNNLTIHGFSLAYQRGWCPTHLPQSSPHRQPSVRPKLLSGLCERKSGSFLDSGPRPRASQSAQHGTKALKKYLLGTSCVTLLWLEGYFSSRCQGLHSPPWQICPMCAISRLDSLFQLSPLAPEKAVFFNGSVQGPPSACGLNGYFVSHLRPDLEVSSHQVFRIGFSFLWTPKQCSRVACDISPFSPEGVPASS